MSLVTDNTIEGLRAVLNTTLVRQTVLNSNIANLDTPGFVPSDIDFDTVLREAHAALRTNPHGTPPPPPGPADIARHSYYRPDREPGLDGNMVDLDVQMARIAQNSTLYTASVQAMSKKLAALRYAVSEGGG